MIPRKRTAINSYASGYFRADTVLAFYALYGDWPAARSYGEMPSAQLCKELSNIVRSGIVKSVMLHEQFKACLLAERYARRRGADLKSENARAAA